MKITLIITSVGCAIEEKYHKLFRMMKVFAAVIFVANSAIAEVIFPELNHIVGEVSFVFEDGSVGLTILGGALEEGSRLIVSPEGICSQPVVRGIAEASFGREVECTKRADEGTYQLSNCSAYVYVSELDRLQFKLRHRIELRELVSECQKD